MEFGFFDNGVIREANLRSFGVASLPTVDFGQSNYVISFGADFLGTWNSPVAQSIGYGHMRQGTPRAAREVRAGGTAHVTDGRERG